MHAIGVVIYHYHVMQAIRPEIEAIKEEIQNVRF
jgi:hypothetical protein